MEANRPVRIRTRGCAAAPRKLRALAAAYIVAMSIAACRSEPPNPDELFQARALGLGYLQRDRFPEAEEAFKKIIALVPKDPFGYTNLGLVYLRMSRFADAEKQLDKAIDLDPGNADIILTLARLYSVTDRVDEARSSLEALSKTEPKNANARYALAELDAQDSTRRASPAYSARLADVLTLEPTNLAVRLKLADALYRRGVVDSARLQLQDVERVPPAPPEVARPFLEESIRLLSDGKGDEARVPLERFLHLMELTSPYQAALREVQWVEGQLPGRPILTFLPQTTIQLRGMGGMALVSDSIAFKDATDEAGLPGPGTAAATTASTQGSAAGGAAPTPTAIATGDFNGDGTDEVLASAWTSAESKSVAHLYRLERWRSADVTTASSLVLPAGAVDAAVGDYDNDGWLDLFVIGTDGRGILEHNKGDGRFEDVTSAARIVAADGATRALWVDLDHDGDLDLVEIGGAADRVYRNNLDGTFTESAQGMGLGAHAGGRNAAFGDFDGDGRVDLVVAYEGDGVVLYRNSAGAAVRFADVTAASGLAASGGARDVAVADFNNDGLLDLLVSRTGGGPMELWRGVAGGRFERDNRSDTVLASFASASAARATFVDVDNDGALDLVIAGVPAARAGARSLALLHNDGSGKYQVRSRLLPATVAASSVVVPIDIDADGDQDLLVGTPTGVALLVNEGGSNKLSVQVTLNGLRTGSGKNNDFGIGARLELRAGTILQTRVVTSRVTHFGLGPHLKADVLRIEWPNGVPQTVFFPGTDQDVLELEALKGSCAFVYTWDGKRFRFVTDVMWRSALGMPVGIMAATGAAGRTVYAPAGASTEYLRIPGDALQPHDGRYRLQLTEELWETAYTDEVKLLAVDHPDSVDVFVDEKFVPPGPTPFRLYPVTGAHPPRSAVDDHGNDVLPALLARDDRYVSNFTATRYQGVVEPHDLVLDLGDEAGASDALLLLRGWIYPSDASINVAIAQQPSFTVSSPSLEVRDARGRWVPAIANIGFPSGKDKTVIVDLARKFPTADHHVRIRTNMQVYWDQALVAHQRPDAGAKVTTLTPLTANLHERGYSRMYRAGGRNGPQWFDYDSVTREAPWRPIDGDFTRVGDVTPLLHGSDDMFVVMAPGDETTIEFDAASAAVIPRGWKRDFILYTDGWIKDSDLNTAFGNTVAPLPFHRISRYPYAPGESYPGDTAHQRYLKEYNTRQAPRR
ncbi:MAG: FG-GAP-like repeat-containing protein [Gemmatimonadota bacterium]